MVAWKTDWTTTKDGIRLRYSKKKAFHKASKAKQITIVMMQGRNEWIEKYHGLETLFPSHKDLAWLTWDHRGQGQSSGMKAHVNSYQDYINDTDHICKELIETDDYYIIAHSMGGLIALLATLQGKIHPKQLFLCSPLLRLPNKPIPRPFARLISGIIGHTKLASWSTEVLIKDSLSFHNNTLTNSYDGFQKILKSPCPIPAPSFQWVHETFLACSRVFEEQLIKNLNCPVTIFGGSEEIVVDYSGFVDWVNKAQNLSDHRVAFHNIIGAKHELLNESKLYQSQVIDKISSYIQRHSAINIL